METPVTVLEPVVSVIIPARNEEANLRRCLESLVAQEGISCEFMVVDDGSTDGTRAIAQSFPGVRVIEPGPLPLGWTGKNNAVTAGAQSAKGKWLLFTDADTVHQPICFRTLPSRKFTDFGSALSCRSFSRNWLASIHPQR
jgi:glycosyltransferase involved in cell wall biosynthesis